MREGEVSQKDIQLLLTTYKETIATHYKVIQSQEESNKQLRESVAKSTEKLVLSIYDLVAKIGDSQHQLSDRIESAHSRLCEKVGDSHTKLITKVADDHVNIIARIISEIGALKIKIYMGIIGSATIIIALIGLIVKILQSNSVIGLG